MGTSGNRNCQRASRSALKDFTDDALTISADSLFQNGTARMVKVNWRRRIQRHTYIAVGGTSMHGRVALGGLDRRRWTPWGIPGDHG